MPLTFPKYEDVKLRKSPLTEVICQARFSPILRIGAEQPVAFQESIRRRFPGIEIEHAFSFHLSSAAHSSAAPPPQVTPGAFRFKSADGHSAVTLSQDFFALATNRYTVWNDFASDLEMVSQAVQDIYRPSPILRLGLRYVNEISPDRLGVASPDEVLSLLRPAFTSLFSTDAWSRPKSLTGQLELDDDSRTLAIRYGLKTGGNNAQDAFILDLDYFEEGQMSLDGLVRRGEEFHQVIYNAFRWAIPEDQFHVFDPEERPHE